MKDVLGGVCESGARSNAAEDVESCTTLEKTRVRGENDITLPANESPLDSENLSWSAVGRLNISSRKN